MSVEEIRQNLQRCQILIVPYCHSDWAWTHTRGWHEMRYVRVFEQVLEILREEPGFRWYFDSWATALQSLLDHRPDLLPELQQRVREGKIAICGGFANVRPNMVGEETFLRSIIHGRRRFARLFPGADLTVHGDIVDVALGHPQVPQIMKLAGYSYYRCWRPQAGLSTSGVPYEWVWEGLDGSQVLCSRGCYGGMCAPDSVPEGYADNWDATVLHMWERELELTSRHSPTGVVWVSQGMDDGLPLRSFTGDHYQDVPGLIREWNQREESPMRFATPVEFYAALEEHRELIPVLQGTLDPCDVCYNAAWGGSEGLWRRRFQADEELVTAELWDAVTAPAERADFAALWENTALFSAHAIQWLFQRDYDELEELADLTILTARRARRTALANLARRVPQEENCAAIVFNSLPFARTATVTVLLTGPHGLPGPVELVDGLGQVVPSQQVMPYEFPGKLWEADAVAQVAIPALGYTTLTWRAAASDAPAGNGRMDNGLLSLEFDEDGRLTTVTGADGAALGSATPWNTLRAHQVDTSAPLHVGPILATEDVVWSTGEVVESGPVRWRHVAEGAVGQHPVQLETLLFAGEARIEFRLTCDWQGGDGFLAAVWPIPAEGRIEADVNFGAEAKELDDIEWGPIEGHRSGNVERLREGMFYARSFVSVHDGTRAVTQVSHDGDRYYLRDRSAATLAQILINSLAPGQHDWERHVNTQRDAIARHHFAWSLVFHEADWRQAGLTRLAAALRRAPEVLAPHGTHHPDLPPCHSLLSLEPANVVLSACYREGGVTLLRVWEAEGQACELVAELPFAPLTASVVDLNGDYLADEAQPVVDGNTLRLGLRAWQVATVQIATEPQGACPGG